MKQQTGMQDLTTVLLVRRQPGVKAISFREWDLVKKKKIVVKLDGLGTRRTKQLAIGFSPLVTAMAAWSEEESSSFPFSRLPSSSVQAELADLSRSEQQ